MLFVFVFVFPLLFHLTFRPPLPWLPGMTSQINCPQAWSQTSPFTGSQSNKSHHLQIEPTKLKVSNGQPQVHSEHFIELYKNKAVSISSLHLLGFEKWKMTGKLNHRIFRVLLVLCQVAERHT